MNAQRAVAVIGLLVASTHLAYAQDETPEKAEKSEKKAKKDKKADEPRSIDFTGRFFARDTFDDATWGNELLISSARGGLALRDDEHHLAAELEIEFADSQFEVKDAWVRYDPAKTIRVQAGHFKRPIGALALASRWALPVAERGAISDTQVPTDFTDPDQLPLGGRDMGVAIRFDPKWLPLDGKLTFGVFRSVVHEQILESTNPGASHAPIGWDEYLPEDLHARFAIEPVQGVEIAASAAGFALLREAGDRESFRRGILGAIDSTVDLGAFRLWAEVFYGTSPAHFGTLLETHGEFAAARALVAYAFEMPCKRLAAIEPFVIAQGADFSSDIDDDRAFGAGGGVAFHFPGDWRVTLSADHTALQPQLGTDVTRFYLQLGARFEP